MNIADIISEYGAYYIDGGQNANRLSELLRFKAETEMGAMTVITNDTVYRRGSISLGQVLQGFQKAWTPKGDLSILPVPINMFKLKADTEEYPDDLDASWLGFLTDNNLDRKAWPFVRWFVEKQIIPQIEEDYELHAVFKGVYAAPTPGTPGAANTSMDGIKKIQDDWVTAGRITPIVTGVPDTDPALWLKQVEDFVDEVDERYAFTKMTIRMSPALAKRYRKGYRAVYGKDMDFDKNSVLDVVDTNVSIKGVASMIGSDRIWVTPDSNFCRTMKKDNFSTVKIENVDRLVKMYTDIWKGVGFFLPEAVFINDQA